MRYILLASAFLALWLLPVNAGSCGKPLGLGPTIHPVEPNRVYYKYELAKYNCTEGYRLRGQLDNDVVTTYRKCTGRRGRGRKWKKPAPKCTRIIECGAPPAGTNVQNVPTTPLRYPEYYVYTCNAGMTTTDDVVVFCLNNGSLSLSNGPTCSPAGCQLPENGTNTVPVVSGGPWDIGQLYIYECSGTATAACSDLSRTCQSDGTWSGTAPTCTVPGGGQEEGGET